MQSNPGSNPSPNPSPDPNNPLNFDGQNPDFGQQPISPDWSQQYQPSPSVQFDPNNPATYSGYYQQPDFYDPNNPSYSGAYDPNAQYYNNPGYDQNAAYYPYNYNYSGTESNPQTTSQLSQVQPQAPSQDYSSSTPPTEPPLVEQQTTVQGNNEVSQNTASPIYQEEAYPQQQIQSGNQPGEPTFTTTGNYDQNQLGLNESDPGYSSVTYPQANFIDYKSTTNYTSPFENSADPYYTSGFNEAQPTSAFSPADPAYYNYTGPQSTEEINVQATPVTENLDNGLPATIAPKAISKRFYIITGAVIAFLVVVLSVAAYFTSQNLQANNRTAANSSVSSSSISSQTEISSSSSLVSSARSVGINFTDPNGPTPADVAKKNEDTVIATDWLRQYFANSLDASGKCTNVAVCGNDADPSKSGLTNLEKFNYGADPNKADTDEDGIADGDEVKVYNTDPTKKSSLNGTGNDFDRIKACQDPALSSNSIDSTISADRRKKLTENISRSKLHEPTITNLKKAGATDSDLQKGFIESSCGGVNIGI